MFARSTRALRVAAVVALGVALGGWIAAPYVRSAALLLDLTGASPRVRAWLPVGRAGVTTRDVRVPTRFEEIPARLYQPVSGTGPMLVVFPGIHGGGVDEPRLVAMARHLASTGASVLTVPLPDLRRYQITTRSTDMLEDATVWAAKEFGPGHGGRVGLIGVSFAGGLALVAAGRPVLADKLTAVFALGAHADLPRVLRYLCNEGTPSSLPPPHDYGVVLMLRQSLHLVVPPGQAPTLDHAIVTFLDASSAESTDRQQAARLFEAAIAEEKALEEPSRSLMHAVNTRDVKALARVLAPFTEQIGGPATLSPARSPATRVPTFLLHGVSDSVIPSTETTALADYLTRAGNTHVEALLTPLLTHADARVTAPAGDVWRLVSFWTRLWKGFR